MKESDKVFSKHQLRFLDLVFDLFDEALFLIFTFFHKSTILSEKNVYILLGASRKLKHLLKVVYQSLLNHIFFGLPGHRVFQLSCTLASPPTYAR